MGMNLSKWQIAGELGLAVSDVQAMTEQLRRGLAARTPAVELTGKVEPDARASRALPFQMRQCSRSTSSTITAFAAPRAGSSADMPSANCFRCCSRIAT